MRLNGVQLLQSVQGINVRKLLFMLNSQIVSDDVTCLASVDKIAEVLFSLRTIFIYVVKVVFEL